MTVESGALSSHAAKASNKTGSPKAASAYEVQTVVTAICIPLCILGLIGNGTILVFLCCMIKKTKYTIYALNITIANLVVLIYHFTFSLIFLKPLYTSILFALIFGIINALGYNACFFILTAFCTERGLFVFFPVWSQQYLSKFNTAIVCISLWAFSCFIAVTEFIACQEKHEDSLSCWATVIFKMFVEVVVFFLALFIFTVALFIRTLKITPRARLDITVITMSVHFLIFDLSVRFFDAIVFWTERSDLPLTSTSIICDIICGIGNPFIYLFVGCWKQPKPYRSLHLCVERALDGNVAETTQGNQEQT